MTSFVFQHGPKSSWVAQQGVGPAECAKRLNPPPPFAERERSVCRIWYQDLLNLLKLLKPLPEPLQPPLGRAFSMPFPTPNTSNFIVNMCILTILALPGPPKAPQGTLKSSQGAVPPSIVRNGCSGTRVLNMKSGT